MRKIFRIFRYVLFLLAFFVLSAAFFFKLNPAFGWNANFVRKADSAFGSLPNYSDGKFQNEIPTQLLVSSLNWTEADRSESFGPKIPTEPVSSVTPTADALSQDASVTWFWHSTYLFGIDGKKILVDPVFSGNISPVPLIDFSRYPTTSDVFSSIREKLPEIDAVLISHDHYDHLDYSTIMGIDSRVKQYFVPLWVGAHLERWGVNPEKIAELNWREKTELDGMAFILAPARHFSWRAWLDANSTLWWGWALIWNEKRLFVSWDSGYGPHFKEMGETYGPFDFTFIEWGQYGAGWPNIHMVPEQSVRAHQDVRWKTMFLSHWSSFTLANHGWKDPIIRAQKEAEKNGVRLFVPTIGQTYGMEEVAKR